MLGEETFELDDHLARADRTPTREPSATLVYSSTTLRIRIGPPSRVRAPMKSYDQTWLGRTAGRLQIACAAVPPAFLPEARLRRGGIRCPSSRHSRSIRLRFTRQPSSRSNDQTLR